MWLSVLLCLLASLAGGASPRSGEVSAKAAVAEDQVQSWTRMWQKRLHLDDWKIETRVVRSCDLKPDTLGNLKWNSATRTAIIRVLNPSDYDMSPSEVPEDMEYTVVHELIHLQLSVLPRDAYSRSTEEQVVNKIADALMSLDKGPEFHARSVPQGNLPPGPGDGSTETAVRQAAPRATDPAVFAPVSGTSRSGSTSQR